MEDIKVIEIKRPVTRDDQYMYALNQKLDIIIYMLKDLLTNQVEAAPDVATEEVTHEEVKVLEEKEFVINSDMTKAELIEFAEAFGVEINSRDTKQQIIDKINNK